MLHQAEYRSDGVYIGFHVSQAIGLGIASLCRMANGKKTNKGEGCAEAAEKAVELAKHHTHGEMPHVFNGSVEHARAHIEESIEGKVKEN